MFFYRTTIFFLTEEKWWIIIEYEIILEKPNKKRHTKHNNVFIANELIALIVQIRGKFCTMSTPGSDRK